MRTKGGRTFPAVRTPGSPGPLLATVQLYLYLINMLTFSCQISFKERVYGRKEKKEADGL